MALGLIDIRAGEKRALLLMSGILAVMTGSHTLLETARDTLFLTKLPPERLALVYVALAVFAVFGGSLSGVASKRFGRRAGLITSLSLAAFFMVLLSLREPTPVMVFGLYLTSGVIGTVVTLQFWLLVGQYFTVSQAKRLFGPMAAGGVLGAALGAATAATLLRFVPATSLLVVGGGLFLLAAAMVTFIPEADGLDDVDLSPTRALAWVHDFAILRTHRYVALVATLLLVSVAAVLLADYLFKSSAAAKLGPAALGTFLGTYYAVQNAVALVVQVFLTGAIVRRIGVTSALLIFPVLLLLGGIGALATGAFAMALLVKGTDGALRHSLHRVTMELLLLPVASDVRDRAKRLLETVFARGAQALAAIVIVILASMGLATVKTLAGLVVALAVLWFMVAMLLRAPYLDLFRRALARGDLADDEQELDLHAVGALLESLSSVEEPTVLAAIDLLDTKGRRKLLPALILYHESPVVLNRALMVFAKEPRRDFVPLAERLLGVRDAGVRASAVRALAVTGRRAAAESALHDDDPRVRGTAAFFLANAEQPDTYPAILHLLEAEDDDGTRARAALLDVIAEHGEGHWRSVVERLVSEPGVLRLAEVGAADSIRRTGATSCLPLLVELLRRRGSREAARTAITSFGSDGEELLTRTLDDPNQPIASRREIPLALAELGTQSAADILMKHLHEKDAILSHRVLRALGRLAAEAKERGARIKFDRGVCEKLVEENLRAYLAILDVRLALEDTSSLAIEDRVSLSLTEGLLVDRSVALLERAFRFLQLANRNEDIRPVFDAVVGGDRRARATAMEFLDALTLGEAAIRELLRVVADDLELGERVRRGRVVRGLPAQPPSAEETLSRLIADEEPLLAALAVACARSARSSELERVVDEARRNRPEVMSLASDEGSEVVHA